MITYILKSASCLALLLFFYHFILEKEKMHSFNRFYLLIGVLVSLLIPFATITIDVIPETITAIQNFEQPFIVEETTAIIIENPINYINYIIGLYLIISSILLIRFGRNLLKIIQKIRLNEKIKHQKAALVLVDDKILPHTFWSYIFINKNEYKNGKIEEELFTHELTHVTQKHTLDVLLIELLQIIFWVNPLFIFLKKAIQLNHEFLADEKVINLHKNTFQYQHLLLNKAAWNNEYYLASNLNYSLTKKRLKMMTTQSSHTKVLLKKLAVIPLLAGFIYLFAERVEAQETQEIIEVVEEVPSQKIKLSETEIYKEYANRNAFITYKDKNGKKISKRYSEMSKEEKQKVKLFTPPLTFKKNPPTKKQFEDLKNGNKVAVWVDGKVVQNEILNKYKYTDFAKYSNSFVHKNARSERFPQKYQASLETKKYFENQNKGRIEKFQKYLKEEYKIEEIKETPKNKDYLDSPIPKKKSSKQSISSTTRNDIRLKLEDLNKLKVRNLENDDVVFNTTGFKIINGKKHFYVKTKNSIKFYNREGKLVNSKGKVLSNKQTNASDVIKGQYITKVYDAGEIVCEFKNNTPSNYSSDTEYDLKEVVESIPPPPIKPLDFVKKQKDKNVDYFYNGKKIKYKKALYLIENNRPINIESKKVNGKMIINLSKEIETIEEVPYNGEIKTYNNLNKTYEELRNKKPHFVKSNKTRQNKIEQAFSLLGSLYFKLSKENKRKTKRPIHPHNPYIRLMKNNKVFYKLRSELTKEDKLLIPPPPTPHNPTKAQKTKTLKAIKDWGKRTGNDGAPPPPEKSLLKEINNQNSISEILKSRKKSSEDVTYYLDGKIISKKELKDLKTYNIKSIRVEKDKNNKDSGSIYIISKK